MSKPRIILVLLCALLLPASAMAIAKVGQPAPDFTLTSSDNKPVKLSELRGKWVVLEWLNHGCPFVKKHYNSGNMQKLQALVRKQGGVWLSVVSSAPGKQGYNNASDTNTVRKQKKSNATAILLDPTGTVGKKYGARTTPQMVLINPKGVTVYYGAIDSIRSTDTDDVSKAAPYLLNAWKEALAGKPVSKPLTVPYGCSVKYAN